MFTDGGSWQWDQQVGLVSYGPGPGKNFSVQCNVKPEVLTDVASQRAWIQSVITNWENTLFEVRSQAALQSGAAATGVMR